MNEKKRKDMIGVLVIRIPICLQGQTMFFFFEEDFLEEECKKKISIFHFLEEN